MKIIILLAVVSLLLAGCVSNNGDNLASSVRLAKNNDTVRVDYVGYLGDGKVFDASIEAQARKAGLPLRASYEPLEFTVGAGQMIAGFDRGVVGMAVNQTKKITVAPKDAYGEVDAAQIIEVPASQLEEAGINVSVGTQVSVQAGLAGVIKSVSSGTATIDFNHPLAGKTLNFNITLVEIK